MYGYGRGERVLPPLQRREEKGLCESRAFKKHATVTALTRFMEECRVRVKRWSGVRRWAERNRKMSEILLILVILLLMGLFAAFLLRDYRAAQNRFRSHPKSRSSFSSLHELMFVVIARPSSVLPHPSRR